MKTERVVFREVAEWTVSGRLFHTGAAATPNARSPTDGDVIW